MKFLTCELKEFPVISVFGIEHLKAGALHKSRTAKEFILYFILDGALHLIDNGKSVTLNEGDVYFFNKGDYHYPARSDECRYIYIHFNNEFREIDVSPEEIKLIEKHNKFLLSNLFATEYDNTIYIPKHFSITKESVKHRIIDNCISGALSIYNKKLDFYKTVSAICATNILIEIYRYYVSEYIHNNTSKAEDIAKKLIAYLNRNFRKNITGDLIENEFGYSIDYINRCFKKYTNKTVFEYLREVRIKNAADMLVVTDLNVTQVAEACGFNDVFHFSKVFKAYYGCSPKKYKT